LRRAPKNGFHVYGLPVRRPEHRNQFQFLYERVNILGLLGLNGGDNNVFTALVPPTGLIEHAIGLANAWSVSKKNLKSRTPTLVLFRLCLSEEPFGTRSRKFGYAHCVDVPATV
jgi:hypothetical protein